MSLWRRLLRGESLTRVSNSFQRFPASKLVSALLVLLLAAVAAVAAVTNQTMPELPVRDFGPREADLRVMVVCGQHPREQFSRALCARWAQLLEHYPPWRVHVRLVMDANPLGTALWERGGAAYECWRGNARGVDLNRNWPPLPHCVHEPADDKAQDATAPLESEWSRGPAPFSEWETCALDALLLEQAPDVLLNVHTGALAMLTPYDGCRERSPTNRRQLIQLAHWLRYEVCDECVVGSGAQALYPASGTLVDYAHHYAQVPLALTLELYEPTGGEQRQELLRSVAQLRCARFFSPDNSTLAYGEHLRRWDRMVLRLARPDNDNMETLLHYVGVIAA